MYAVLYRCGLSSWRPLVRCATPVPPRVSAVELPRPSWGGWTVGIVVRTPRSAIRVPVSSMYDGALRVIDRPFTLVPRDARPASVAWIDPAMRRR
jgi:hypothetical protein